MREYRAEVALLADKYIGRPLKEVDLSSMIRDIVGGALKFHIEIPTDFMLVGKTLMTIEVIGKELDPDLDVYGLAAPALFELLKKRYSPQRLGNELWRGVEQLSRAGYDMPMQLREVLDDLRLGRLALRAWDPEVPRAADRLGRRVFMGMVVAALALSGTLLVYGEKHAEIGVGMLILAGLAWLGHAALDLTRAPRR
jgi:ubiquinone biosynthesis protein